MPNIPPHTAIIIPAYNENKSLPKLLDSLSCFRDITFIIDDNSEDDTAEIIKRKGFYCFKNTEKKGTSGSIVSGLYHALSQGFKNAITIDADGQHDINYVKEFAEAVEKGCFVCGNRFKKLDFIPSNKLTSNCFASKIVKQYLHTNIPDVACGYRAFNIQKYLKLATKYSLNDFELIYSFLYHAITTNEEFEIVPIPAIYYPEKLWDTSRKEVFSLILTTCKYKQDETLLSITKNLNGRCSFECVVDNTLFHFYYMNSFDSYFIEADLKDIYSYYNNMVY